jgi:t-SNARE complex subunit (syntaxin)
MNITKEYYEYTLNSNSINQSFEQYKFKCNKYSPMYKCNRLLISLKEVENNIIQLSSISKKSSSFNNTHMKISNAVMDIKKSLIEIEHEISEIKSKELSNPKINKFSKLLLQNSLDILNSRISDLTMKFKKLLELQASKIKQIEDRKIRLTPSSKRNINNTINEYITDLSNDNYNEEDVLLEVKEQRQTMEQKESKYYQNRLKDVQAIEKTMGEIAGMMNRLSQMTYEHSLIIDNISKNTDIALVHVEKGEKEVKKILDNVKNNRWLLIRIFMIIICVSVFYIIFIA